MAVTIDIPGVGNVEAKNAASEATLREILKAMQGVEKKITGKNSKGGPGGDAPSDDPVKGPGVALGAAFGKLSKTVMPVIGGFQAFGNALSSITNIIGGFANVGDSIERAAQQIPIFSGMLGTVAAASAKVNNALLTASRSGAGFGDSITQFAGAASAAGMTLDNFGALVAKNGEGMLGFGGTTEEGAKRFSQVSKALRTTSGDLYALGFSTEDINQGLASYGQLMRTQGLQGKQSNDQMVNGAKTYLKELDAMAKITGEERSAKESQMKALAQDAQFQASMAGKSAEARQSFLTTVGKIPGPLQGFVKDFLATGTLTTEETQRIGAMMGGDVMRELQGLRSKLQSGAVLSAEEQDRLGIIMKRAAEQQLKNAGTSLAGATEMQGAVVAVSSALGIQEGAVKKSAEEQRKSALEGSGFNKKIQEIQQRLAAFSNSFQIALANSGVLDFLIKSFSVMANLVQTFVVPAFNILAGVISTVGSFLIDTLTPVFQTIGTIISTAVVPVFEYLSGIVNEYVVPAFEYVSAFIQDNLTPIMYGLGTALLLMNAQAIIRNTIEAAGNALAMVRNGLLFLTNINLAVLAGAALAASLPILAFVAPIVAIIALFKYLYDKGWSFGSVFEAVGDNLKRFMIFLERGFLNLLDKITFGDANKVVKANLAKLDADKQELDDREAARDKKREATAKERQNEKDKNANDRERNKVDKKELADKKAIADEKSKLDYNSSTENLAKQFAIKEGSSLVPKNKEPATAKAEATKKEIEQKGEEKTAAEKKAAEEQAKAEEKSKAENKKEGKGAAPAQESAESLLASLNTKMTELIKINKGTQAVSEQQLSVQKGMTSDLFAA